MGNTTIRDRELVDCAWPLDPSWLWRETDYAASHCTPSPLFFLFTISHPGGVCSASSSSSSASAGMFAGDFSDPYSSLSSSAPNASGSGSSAANGTATGAATGPQSTVDELAGVLTAVGNGLMQVGARANDQLGAIEQMLYAPLRWVPTWVWSILY